jgi:hypothetical protein
VIDVGNSGVERGLQDQTESYEIVKCGFEVQVQPERVLHPAEVMVRAGITWMDGSGGRRAG